MSITEAGEPARLGAWDVLDLPGPVPAANFLTSPHARQYRLLVRLLAEQQAHSLTGVAHDELAGLVKHHLPAPEVEALVEAMNLDDRLSQLVAWRVCTSWQDTASTEEDFLRNRYRYQLTEEGVRLHELAARLEEGFGATSTAALMAPAILADNVSATLKALDIEDYHAANQSYATVETTLGDLAVTASSWQTRLAAAMGGPLDEATVVRSLETILAYIEAWGSGVDTYTVRIAEAQPRLASRSDEVWRAIALDRVGTNSSDDVIASTMNELKAVATTLRRWFCPPSPQAQWLRRQMRDVIAPVLHSHRTLLSVGGTISRQADLVRLAHTIENAPAADAWPIWASATGLFSARHFTVSAPEVGQSAQLSSWDAPPARISQRLRAQGRRSLSGRVARMPDRSEARRAARHQAARDRVDRAAAEQRLVARSGTLLSTWDPLDSTMTEVFLELVSAARNRRAADNTMHGISQDGRWTIILTPTAPPATAIIATPTGRLAMTDAIIELRR